MKSEQPFHFSELIAKKRDGLEHSEEEIAFIAGSAAAGSAPDYQLSAWLMAVCLRGMTRRETAALTQAMARSGRSLELGALRGRKVDKHSTGGVGDGISLALAPLVASAGAVVPMMSGRGLGHTGGTLDKLESVPGLRVRFRHEEVESQLRSLGVCLFGQSEDLAPADRKLYALRDATATVGSLPLIVASILSKKLAEGLDALVLDIKCGSGAIFSEPRKAEELAVELIRTARSMGLRCVGFLTAMEQPLGHAIGPALEMRQAIEVLQGDLTASDYVEVLLALGGEMAALAGKARNREEGSRRLLDLIRSGEGIRRLRAMLRAQGGDARVVENPGRFLPTARRTASCLAPRTGYITRLDARLAGRAAVALGAGRDRMEDKLDFGAGIRLRKKVGDHVSQGDEIATLYASDAARLAPAKALLDEAVSVGRKPARAPKTILKVWR